jgi:hypothetical protein
MPMFWKELASSRKTAIAPSKNGKMALNTASDYDGLVTTHYGMGTVFVQKKNTILLGETKYYQAKKDPQDPTKIILAELVKTSQATEQDFSTVTFSVTTVSGDKLGAYWGMRDEENTPLRSDIIRLVGRYWKSPDASGNNTYQVNLTANAGSRTGAKVIEVTKPAKLGNSHSTVTDVFGRGGISLDSLIIQFAGIYGIPPQVIKGQMRKEGADFRPAWRYEPFLDARIQGGRNANRYFSTDLPFVVDATTMGTGDLPNNHTNEDPKPYVGTPAQIGTYAAAHWSDYVQNHSGSTPDSIIGSSVLTQRWRELYSEIKNDKTKKTSDHDARIQVHNALKLEIQDRKNKIGKLFDIIAQTRKVTSYGLTQMMYITAADNFFDNNHYECYDPSTTRYVNQNDAHTYPEKLNEQNFLMTPYCEYQWKLLNFTFTGCIPDGDWQGGFEAKWENALVKYNGAGDYGRSVLSNAQDFKPSN